MKTRFRSTRALLRAAWPALLTACASSSTAPSSPGDPRPHRPLDAIDAIDAIETVVVICAENRAFDNLYGLFPGANGIPGRNPSAVGGVLPQREFDGSKLPVPPPAWGGLTAGGQPVVPTQAQSTGMPNRPFQIDDPQGLNGTGVVVPQSTVTRDLVHRFYDNMMRIHGGHAPVPTGDRRGPGTRVPALIVSPYARKGFVGKTPYDTGSILRFITRRWSLVPLPGITERYEALRRSGSAPMGDLSGALEPGA